VRNGRFNGFEPITNLNNILAHMDEELENEPESPSEIAGDDDEDKEESGSDFDDTEEESE